MKKSVLITGGQGDLSKELVSSLTNNYDVSAPNRLTLDVSNIDSVNDFFKDKHFDIVINNAGTLYSSLIDQSEPEKWINDIHVNLIGTYLICRLAVKSNPKVTIINVASTAAYASYKDWSSYCCAKAGVLTFSNCLKNDGYEVYCLCPGAIDTKIRNGLNIPNNNVMSTKEGAKPFIDVLDGKYQSGDVIFYRKGELQVNP